MRHESAKVRHIERIRRKRLSGVNAVQVFDTKHLTGRTQAWAQGSMCLSGRRTGPRRENCGDVETNPTDGQFGPETCSPTRRTSVRLSMDFRGTLVHRHQRVDRRGARQRLPDLTGNNGRIFGDRARRDGHIVWSTGSEPTGRDPATARRTLTLEIRPGAVTPAERSGRVSKCREAALLRSDPDSPAALTSA